MRIFRGLENIHSVIDRHEAEWRKEQGEEPERSRLPSLEEAVRRRLTAQPDEGSGRFAADRFLGGKNEPLSLRKPPMPEPEAVNVETETVSVEPETVNAEPETANAEPETVSIEPETVNAEPETVNAEPETVNAEPETVNAEPETVNAEPETANAEPETVNAEPETVSIEPETVNAEPEAVSTEPETANHSWLYNEVMKAVNGASDGNTKIVAVFVPVIQNTGEARDIPASDDEADYDGENVSAVEIIRNKDGKHSQLYDEVMRAVNDSAGDSRKIVAVFVPLVQNGQEFEDLPADETVTLSPVNEDAVKIEAVPEAEAVLEAETVPEIDAVPALSLVAEPEAAEDIVLEEILESEESPSQEETESEQEIAPETEPEQPAIPEAEDFNLIPEGQEEPDAELAEAFREMEEKFDEKIQEEQSQDSDVEEIVPEIVIVPEDEPEQEQFQTETDSIVPDEDTQDIPEYDDDVLPDGEPMEYEEIDSIGQNVPEPEEFSLPDALDDDEILDDGEFDETLTEIHRPDDEENVVILEKDDDFPDDDDEEIELIPDPVKVK